MRQGEILSPSLLCFYLDSLLEALRKSGLGCHIVFFGAVGYADDILLLAPSRESLQLMLKICEDFSSESLLNSVNDIKCGRVNPLMDNEEWKPQLLEELSIAKLGFLEN